MLIEDLIRLGRPLLGGDMTTGEVLRLITDIGDERVKNFYRNVFVVVLPEAGKPIALARQKFNESDDNQPWKPSDRVLGVPVVLPSGGNPLNAQGCYGLPAYPLYDRHIQAFRESADGVADFLAGRLERTPFLQLDQATIRHIAEAVHERVKATDLDPKKNLGVLLLAQCGEERFYRLNVRKPDDGRIGEMPDGLAIVPNLERILAAIWEGKVAEGREAGTRSGPCSIAGTGEEVVSAYCKAWPWAFPTWNCPLPQGGDVRLMVEGIGLAPETYRALTLGACVFNRLTRRLSHIVVPEIFSPADTRPGREQAQKRKDLPSIYGSAFLLPVRDEMLKEEGQRYEFVKGIRGMLTYDPEANTQEERSIATVVGVEQIIPEEFGDDYRLTLVYFSGEYSRGDIHLRAFIQDVVPSRLGQLREIARDEAPRSMQLVRRLLPGMSERQQNWLAPRYQSVPYLLARAYGGPYLWAQLETVLHGRRLDPLRVTRNLARRLESLVPTWPKSGFAITDEIAFYLNFLRFLGRINRDVARPEDFPMPIQNWRDMLKAIETGPVGDLLTGTPDAAELGFACGAIVKRFSRRYHVGMRKYKHDADFLRDRVLTFGSALRWDAVQHRALRFINELPNNQLRKSITFSRDLAERAGAISDAVRRNVEAIESHKDDFLTAFWSGYSLQGYDRPKPVTHAGTVVRVEGDQFVIRLAQNNDEHGYRKAARCKVMINGKKVELDDIKPGMNVWVTAKEGDNKATRIEARHKSPETHNAIL